jgi:hypothetical protein
MSKQEYQRVNITLNNDTITTFKAIQETYKKYGLKLELSTILNSLLEDYIKKESMVNLLNIIQKGQENTKDLYGSERMRAPGTPETEPEDTIQKGQSTKKCVSCGENISEKQTYCSDRCRKRESRKKAKEHTIII